MKNNKYANVAFFALLSVMLVLAVQAVLAATVPAPPDTIVITPGTRSESSGGTSVYAQSGNVTALVITDVTTSQFWQGYYGNITGRIVLDDAANNTLFAWELATPGGEIYAVNTSNVVSWTNVSCVNFTAQNATNGGDINLSKLAVQYNMNITNLGLHNMSKEGFNYTFNNTFASPLTVGARTIPAGDNCPLAYTFVDEAYQTGKFREVLLWDNASALIFAALLESNADGYQVGSNDLSDFQMLVAEDGSPGSETVLHDTYYFYVELN